MYFYKITTLDSFGFPLNYFITTNSPVRRAANVDPIPEKVRLLIDDRYETIRDVTYLAPLAYFYEKFIKYNPSRVNWEKEKI